MLGERRLRGERRTSERRDETRYITRQPPRAPSARSGDTEGPMIDNFPLTRRTLGSFSGTGADDAPDDAGVFFILFIFCFSLRSEASPGCDRSVRRCGRGS